MTTQASFSLRGRNPDVLSCIANLSNDEVFTPPELANRMLDMVAEAWAADRPAERLWHAAVLVRDEAAQLARGKRGTLGLTGAHEIPKLAGWFAAVNRARELLATPVRGELVVLDLLHAWQTPRSS